MHEKNSIKILVDYLCFTIGRDCFIESVGNPDFEDETDRGILTLLCLIFGFGDLEWNLRRGYNGYDLSYQHEGITLCWGGCDTIMVQMSGKGCRFYESLKKRFNWVDLIKLVQCFQRHNFSRLDIACDTFDILNMQKLMQYTLEQRYVSRFNDYFVGQGNKEESVIFGSPSSRMRLRIYNKTLERTRALGSAVGVPENWIRLEFQLRDEAADSYIKTWQSAGNISTAYFGIMANQLRYVKERRLDNVTRSVMIPWWRKFLDNADKIPMAYPGGLEYNLQSLQRYIFGQAGGSIRTWFDLHEYDWKEFLMLLEKKELSELEQKRKAELKKIIERFMQTISHRKLNDRQKNLLQNQGVVVDAVSI